MVLRHGHSKKEDENRLLMFEMTCLRKILGITRMDTVKNVTIGKQLNMQQTVINQICQKRLRYFGHIERMPATRLPKIALEGRIKGNRPRGRPPKRWSDCLNTDCRQKYLCSLAEASQAARDHLLKMAGNHEADATTQLRVRVKGIGQGQGQGSILHFLTFFCTFWNGCEIIFMLL